MKKLLIIAGNLTICLVWVLALLFVRNEMLIKEYYSRDGELYYHAVRTCGGMDFAGIQDTEGLDPCPVCVQREREIAGVDIFRVGSFRVVRMTDEWMAGRTAVAGIFADMEEEIYRDPQAYEKELAVSLHGREYARFKKRMKYGMTARAKSLYPWTDCKNSEGEWMHSTNTRALYGAWYQAFPEAGDISDLRFCIADLTMKDNSLIERVQHEWYASMDGTFTLPAEKEADAEAVMTYTGDGFSMVLHKLDEVYFAELSLMGNASALQPEITMNCAKWHGNIVLEHGYAEDWRAVYGAVLTCAEAKAIMDGAAVTIDYAGILERTDFAGTEYGIGNGEGGRHFVADRNGDFILEPEWLRVERSGNVFFARRQIRMNGLPEETFYENLLYDADARRQMMVFRGSPEWDLRVYESGIWFERAGKVRVAEVYAGDAAEPFLKLGTKDFANREYLRIYGGFTVFSGPMTEKTQSWFTFGESHPENSDGRFMMLLGTDEQCVAIVWNPEGEMIQCPEGLREIARFESGDA